MLILTRKLDESIMLGKDIEIKVLGIEDGKVKLGIDAPRDVDIFRKEIYMEIEAENKEAASDGKDLESLKDLFKK
ncbi:carbon storage regulator CsrA [Isachenkonia alkalipeptolytica]|uniref:Translational regulator CsrA n=1 Tax=Isachenkonia alkalipeptolytica TaxID=2565777 RepID=A0AA44BF75_9CLOT|nr:carbon storage regulator CsrA [Isachenkonia alkalipeptolytica]NBG88301.1 carbon storage regulator CsrA [Isachenkonia alkalipeptolytica]